MPSRATLALVVLGWVALWPLLHRGLVARFEVNPWKLGGLAMYTTAVPPLGVVVLRKSAQGLVAVDERQLDDETRRELERFRIRRHALGELQSADPLGRQLLAALPDADWLVIAVQRLQLDPTTARLKASTSRFLVERGVSGTTRIESVP